VNQTLIIKMGAQKSKQETINEQINVNTGSVAKTSETSAANVSKLEIFAIAFLAVIISLLLLKIAKHYFKKSVRQYAVNV
jgi:hypothetical protein